VKKKGHQWTGAPTDGQGATVKKKAGIRLKEPASRKTPASHERCEREKGQKKEDSVVCEVRSRQNKVSEDMSDSYTYVLTSFAVLSPSFSRLSTDAAYFLSNVFSVVS
jgi:hypothetical protein